MSTRRFEPAAFLARYDALDAATMATQRDAFEVCASSPWGADDYHAQLLVAGDSKQQLMSFAETWVLTPQALEVPGALRPIIRGWWERHGSKSPVATGGNSPKTV